MRRDGQREEEAPSLPRVHPPHPDGPPPVKQELALRRRSVLKGGIRAEVGNPAALATSGIASASYFLFASHEVIGKCVVVKT